MNYSYEYIKRNVGECFAQFIRPFMEKYNLTINLELTSQPDGVISLVNADDQYAGKIEIEKNGMVKYYIYLNKQYTVALSGELRNNMHVCGCLMQMDEIQTNSLVKFKTFRATYSEGKFDYVDSLYDTGVAEISKRQQEINWSWIKINYLFTRYGNYLISDNSNILQGADAEKIMNSLVDIPKKNKII